MYKLNTVLEDYALAVDVGNAQLRTSQTPKTQVAEL